MLRILSFAILVHVWLATLPLQAREVVFDLRLKAADSQQPVKATLILEGLNESSLGDGPAVVRVPVTAPGKVNRDLEEGSRWRVSVEGTGLWAESRTIEVGTEALAIKIPLFPAGAIEGSLSYPGDATPTLLRLRFQPPPGAGPGSLPTASQECLVQAGRFRCRLPAGVFDLKLHTEGYVAHYYWAVEVPRDGRHQLGSLRFKRGASVVGWVEAPERVFDYSECSVVLARVAVGLSSAVDRSRTERENLRGKVNQYGFFQLAGLPAGGYEVRVHHPRYATTRYGPVQVVDRIETEIPTLALSPPADLAVVVHPAADPFHKPWTLRLHTSSPDPNHLDLVESSTVSRNGTWKLAGLDPGTYQLTVVDSREATWWRDELELFPGETEHRVDLPFVRLEGLLTLDDEPVEAARVEFKESRNGAQTSVESNEEGRFYIFLPRGKKWEMEVSQQPLGVWAFFKEVTVPLKEPGEPWAKKEFEIPNTTIEGEVVNSEGQPLPSVAIVDTWRQARYHGRRTEADGTFLFRGLEPGRIGLQASWTDPAGDRSSMSEMVYVALAEGSDRVTPVRLVLQEQQRLEGLVVSPGGGGVPGARIMGLLTPKGGQVLTPWVLESHTDLDGIFELTDLPASASEVRLTIYPPGFAVTQLRVELPALGPVIIPVGSVGGTLIVTYEEPPVAFEDLLLPNTMIAGRMTLVSQYALKNWAGLHGEMGDRKTFIIPMLEPGAYTACFGPQAGSALLSGSGLPPAVARNSCVSGELGPYGRLELRIPRSAIKLDIPDVQH